MTEDHPKENEDRPPNKTKTDRDANDRKQTRSGRLFVSEWVFAEIGIVKRLIRSGSIVVLGQFHGGPYFGNQCVE